MTTELKTGFGGSILGKLRPYLGKMRSIWAICTKSGQKNSRIGRKKFNHVKVDVQKSSGSTANFIHTTQPNLGLLDNTKGVLQQMFDLSGSIRMDTQMLDFARFIGSMSVGGNGPRAADQQQQLGDTPPEIEFKASCVTLCLALCTDWLYRNKSGCGVKKEEGRAFEDSLLHEI